MQDLAKSWNGRAKHDITRTSCRISPTNVNVVFWRSYLHYSRQHVDCSLCVNGKEVHIISSWEIICSVPLPSSMGDSMLQKALWPEVLQAFATGLEAELQTDCHAKPDPALLKEFLERMICACTIFIRHIGAISAPGQWRGPTLHP